MGMKLHEMRMVKIKESLSVFDMDFTVTSSGDDFIEGDAGNNKYRFVFEHGSHIVKDILDDRDF